MAVKKKPAKSAKPARRAKPKVREMIRRRNLSLVNVTELPGGMAGDEPRFEVTEVVGGHVVGTYTAEQIGEKFEPAPSAKKPKK